MKSSEVVGELLRRADMQIAAAAIVTPDETAAWPSGLLTTMLNSRILVPSQPNATITCDACYEEHSEPVVFIDSRADGVPRAFIACPVVGRVAVDVTRLQRWSLDCSSLATIVARLLGTLADIAESVEGRLWRLGSRELHGVRYDFLLVRGLHWPDETSTRALEEMIGEMPRTVVLTVGALPMHDSPATVIPLSEVLRLRDGHVELDWEGILTSLSGHRHPPAETLRSIDPGYPTSEFRSLRIGAEDVPLSEAQVIVVQMLRDASKAGSPDVATKAIMGKLRAKLNVEPHSMRDIFRTVPEWQQVIITLRKGTYRLKQ